MANSNRFKPILQQDLISNAKNWYSDKMPWFVFGKNTNVDNAVVDLWEWPTGRYVFPTVPMQMAVSSSDNTNDKAWGTGALTVMIHYLDTDYAMQSEIITLNGTTPVNTVATDILRINDFHIKTVGSSGVAAGTISVKNTGWTVTYSTITAWFTASRQAIYTVPAWYVWYINHWQASSGSTTWNHFTQVTLLAKAHNWVVSTVFIPVDEIGTQDWPESINFPIPIMIPATCDVKISAVSDWASSNVTALGAIMGWFETI